MLRGVGVPTTFGGSEVPHPCLKGHKNKIYTRSFSFVLKCHLPVFENGELVCEQAAAAGATTTTTHRHKHTPEKLPWENAQI